MANHELLLLCLVNFGFIALLPRKFFKQGARLDRQFWLTAAPLFASPACLGLAFYNILPPFIAGDSPIGDVLGLLSVCIACLSILILGLAIGTHRIPLHMFHDQGDAGISHLVTYGPYRYVRHPIYASYLFALFAGLLACPQIGTAACFLYGLIVLNRTAALEESRLSTSPDFGDEYKNYIMVSGRFLPPMWAMRMTTPTIPAHLQRTQAKAAPSENVQTDPLPQVAKAGADGGTHSDR